MWGRRRWFSLAGGILRPGVSHGAIAMNRIEQNRTEQNRIVVQLEGTYNDHLVQLLHHFRADQK